MNTLQLNSRGDDVKILQRALGVTPDGIFGQATDKALRAFQSAHGLKADGIAGAATWAALVGAGAGRVIDAIVIHCTAGSQRQTPAQVVDYHTRSEAAGGLGWSAPGYHYIIAPDGSVVSTWPEAEPSNGVAGHNAHILNIAWIGGIDSAGRELDNRTPAQKAAMRSLLSQLRSRYPKARITGHRDIASVDSNHNGIIDPWERVKACPCFDAEIEFRGL